MAKDLKKEKNEAMHYDHESDVLYFGIKKGAEDSFVEVAPGVNIEVDSEGQVLGVEILEASLIFGEINKSGVVNKQTVK